MKAAPAPLLSAHVTESIKEELLDTVRAAQLSRTSEDAVLTALGGPTRVLPEGKANLCAALTYLSYVSVAREEPLRIIPGVVAMEMLMAAGDLIDDIQDDEAGPPEDHGSLGQALETLAFLLKLSHSAVLKAIDRGVPAKRVLRALRVFDQLGVQALKGQALDINLESRPNVSVEDCLNVSRLKSASLVKCAAELGAAFATEDSDKIELYAQLGWHFGLMMQLMNDIAAVWPGGPEKSDLRLRKKTLPVAFALNLPNGCGQHAGVVQSYYANGAASGTSEEDVKSALWSCGAIHYTWVMAATEKAKVERVGQALSRGTFDDWPLARLLT